MMQFTFKPRLRLDQSRACAGVVRSDGPRCDRPAAMSLQAAPRVSMVFLMACVIGLAGCQLGKLGALAEIKETREAEYAGLPGKRVAIVVWLDEQSAFEYPVLAFDLMNSLQAELDRNLNRKRPKDVKPVRFVPHRDVLSYQERNPEWFRESYEALGQRFGADVLLVIEVSEFSTREPDSPDIYRGRLQATVTVMDVTSDKARQAAFFDDLNVRYPERGMHNADSNDIRVRQETLAIFADRAAKKFYKYEEVIK